MEWYLRNNEFKVKQNRETANNILISCSEKIKVIYVNECHLINKLVKEVALFTGNFKYLKWVDPADLLVAYKMFIFLIFILMNRSP